MHFLISSCRCRAFQSSFFYVSSLLLVLCINNQWQLINNCQSIAEFKNQDYTLTNKLKTLKATETVAFPVKPVSLIMCIKLTSFCTGNKFRHSRVRVINDILVFQVFLGKQLQHKMQFYKFIKLIIKLHFIFISFS